jgi:hypothetical protein
VRGNIVVDNDGEATVLSNAAADETRRVWRQEGGDPGLVPLYLSHFATCPNSARHRTK